MADVAAKRIVCLANSRKEGDRCIAGKELLADGSPGGWVRPVSDREDEAVNASERQYEDGSEPHLLDAIDVPVRQARPKGHQQENWLLDPDRRWRRIRSPRAGRPRPPCRSGGAALGKWLPHAARTKR